MIRLLAERLALIGALASLVLAVLWPHVRSVARALCSKIRPNLCPASLGDRGARDSQGDAGELDSRPDIASKDPRVLSRGSPIRRPRLFSKSDQSTRDSYTSTQSGQSVRVAPDPGLDLSSLDRQARHPGPLSAGLGGTASQFAHDARRLAGKNDGQSSMGLLLFSAAVIALIVFTIMKLFSARCGSSQSQRLRPAVNKVPSPNGFASDSDQMNKCGLTLDEQMRQLLAGLEQADNDFQSTENQRARLSKISREERIRKKILRNGGKGLSNAIRYLVSELERQKQLLIEESCKSTTDSYCGCPCHEQGETDNVKVKADSNGQETGFQVDGSTKLDRNATAPS